MHRPTRTAVLVLAALLATVTGAGCSAGVGDDWPAPPGGVLASCRARGDRCGGSGWCGPTPAGALTCCPVALDATGYCPAGEVPGVVECAVDADCPHEECHETPACLGGVCFAPVQAVRTYCSAGACDESGACVPCHVDADCEAVNTNECYRLMCSGDGTCKPQMMQPGEACNFTDGTCNDGATCIVH